MEEVSTSNLRTDSLYSVESSVHSDTREMSNYSGISEGDDSRLWESYQALKASVNDIDKEIDNINNNNFDTSLNESRDSPKISVEEQNRTESPKVTLDKNKRKSQPKKIVKVLEKPNAIQEPLLNQQPIAESNYASNEHLQHTLPVNPTSDPNVQQMMLLQMMQQNYMMNPQVHPQIYPHLYPSMYLPMNPQIHPHMSPSMNSHMSPHMSPSMNPYLSPQIISEVNVAKTPPHISPPIDTQVSSQIPPHTNLLVPQQVQSQQINPLMNPLLYPPITPLLDFSRTPPYMLHQQYQQKASEVQTSNGQHLHSKTMENVHSTTDQESSKQSHVPNLPDIQLSNPEDLRQVNSYETKQTNSQKTKKRSLSEANHSSPQKAKKSKSRSVRIEQQIPNYPMTYEQLLQQYLQPPRLQYDELIQQKYLNISQEMGPGIMHEIHKKLTEEYYPRYIQEYRTLYKSKPDPVRSNPLASPVIAQQWYHSLIFVYAQLMKKKYELTLTQNDVEHLQMPTETLDPAEVAYWNDFVIRQSMSEFAGEDPAKFQLHLMAKRQELNEIMLTGTTSGYSGISAF